MQASRQPSSSQDSKEPNSKPLVVIVGAGLAGTIMGRTLERQGIPIKIWDQPNLGSASRVAAGIYCPINFHRLIPGWRVEEAVPKMLDFFAQEERYFGIPLMSHVPYWKPLTEEEQVAHWRRKMEEYPDWLDINEGDQEGQAMNRICQHWDVKAWGIVKASGWLNVEQYLQACHAAWELKGCFVQEPYPESTLSNVLGEGHSKMIVDARGFYAWKEQQSLSAMRPAQGELVEFELEGWPQNKLFKKELFIQPLGGQRFRAGATFEWNRLSPVPTEEGKARLNADLQKMLGPWWPKVKNLTYKAGIRPSSHDRRPYVGADPKSSNHFVFNGFGAKGVLLAPMMAEEFTKFMMQQQPLHPEAAMGR
jgi:glycine/D-amino acid oxidase-like deaminating enzyme